MTVVKNVTYLLILLIGMMSTTTGKVSGLTNHSHLYLECDTYFIFIFSITNKKEISFLNPTDDEFHKPLNKQLLTFQSL